MRERLKRLLQIVGPGVITGAADDDPSGIATYSQTGAQFGYGQLWMMLVMLPMMIVVQEMCGRIGITKGKGIAGILRDHYPGWVLLSAVWLMVVANVINLGADLGAMAAAARLLIPVPFLVLVVAFAVASVALQMYSSYKTYSRYLKGLTVCLLAYVVTAFVVRQDWKQVALATLVPHVEYSFEYLMIMVGLLGTTISPYLFFWQASQEVEEAKAEGKVPSAERRIPVHGPLPKVTHEDVRSMRIDTVAGMCFSQIAAWFIIITAAGSLHRAGKTDVATAADAARALEPLVKGFPHAGEIASAIFAFGIIGLGLLAIPTFAGSAAYALAEVFGWNRGLARQPKNARGFYTVIVLATLGGVAIDLFHVSPMKALIYAAVINGVVAAPLILLILLIGRNREIMGEYANGLWANVIGWITFAAMCAAAAAMVISFSK